MTGSDGLQRPPNEHPHLPRSARPCLPTATGVAASLARVVRLHPLPLGRSGWRTVRRSLVVVAEQDRAEAETAEILADTTLMAAIREGLAEAKAGRTSTHQQVVDQYERRRSPTGEVVPPAPD